MEAQDRRLQGLEDRFRPRLTLNPQEGHWFFLLTIFRTFELEDQRLSQESNQKNNLQDFSMHLYILQASLLGHPQATRILL